MALLAGVPGACVLVVTTAAAANAHTVQAQLGHVSVGLVGVFLVGVGMLGLWGHQRRREAERLTDVETYAAVLAAALGLRRATGQRPRSEPDGAAPARRARGHLERSRR